MQLGSDVQIPDGLLAEVALLREKPHSGVPSRNLALHQGIDERNSTVAIGLRAGLLLNRVQSRYTGKERDTESGLDYFGARYYASTMGRWMSPDWAESQRRCECHRRTLSKPVVAKELRHTIRGQLQQYL